MSLRYLDVAQSLLDRMAQQESNIRAAANVFADAIGSGNLVHLFGAGHSRMGVEEIFPRIGSIVGYHPIVELALSYYTNVVGTMGLAQALFLERVDGYGETILGNYEFRSGDAAMVISSTGINNVPVEVALGLKERGLPLVAVTSIAHSSGVASRHPSGKRLYEIADVVIDNCSAPGDAAVHVDGCEYPVSATSTLGTVLAIHSVNAVLAEELVSRGTPPVVLGSPHFSDQEAARRNLGEYYDAYRERLRRR